MHSRAEKVYTQLMDTPQMVELTRSERELLLNIRHITPDVEKKIVSSRITGNRFHDTRNTLPFIPCRRHAEYPVF